MDSTAFWRRCQGLRRAMPMAAVISGALLCMPQFSAAWNSAAPAWSSAASFGGTGSDIGEAVKIDREGNRYVTGSFSATAYFPGRATQDGHGDEHASQTVSGRKILTAVGGRDAFLAKYDRDGKLQWLVQAGGGGDDHGYDLAFDGAGNVYMAGSFLGSATFHGTNGTREAVSGPGQTIFLAKYRPSGALVWVQTGAVFFGTNEGYGVAVEPITGSVYVTGISQGETTFSSSDRTTHPVAGPGTWHMFLVKYDTGGRFHWGQSNVAEPNSIGRRVAVDEDNNAYVTGWLEAQTTFGSADGRDLTVVGFSGPVQSAPDYPGDAYVVKYDEDGNAKWVNHIGGYKAIPIDIATSRDGRVSVTGFIGNIGNIGNSSREQTETIVTSQPGGRDINLGGGKFTQPFNRDIFFATYDDAGVLLEARRFGGPQDKGGSAIAYDRHGNLVIAGTFRNTIKIDGRTLTGKGSFNLFVAGFSRDSRSCGAGDSLSWIEKADGVSFASFESGARIGLTGQGNVLVTGAYQPAAQFGGFRLQSLGAQDGLLAFLRASPKEEDHRQHAAEQSDRD